MDRLPPATAKANEYRRFFGGESGRGRWFFMSKSSEAPSLAPQQAA
jgi:hypothetical protein